MAAIVPPPHWQALVRGGDDPLLPHLRAHLTSAVRVDIAVAFMLESGLARIDEHLKDVVRRGGSLRILTGDYLDITEPNALRRLLDLAALASQGQGTVELRIFETAGEGFHPKATVIDYIGNHRTFLLKPQVLLGLEPSEVAAALTRAEAYALDLPPGCEITYDLRAIEILRAPLPTIPTHDALRAWYEDFRERHGVRPRAVEA